LSALLPGVAVLPNLLRVLLAGLIMTAMLLVGYHLSLLVLIPLGAAIYGLGLLCTGAVTRGEVRAAAATIWPKARSAAV